MTPALSPAGPVAGGWGPGCCGPRAFILGTFSLRFLVAFLSMLCRKQTRVSLSAWPTRLETAETSGSLVLGPQHHYLFTFVLSCLIDRMPLPPGAPGTLLRRLRMCWQGGFFICSGGGSKRGGESGKPMQSRSRVEAGETGNPQSAD